MTSILFHASWSWKEGNDTARTHHTRSQTFFLDLFLTTASTQELHTKKHSEPTATSQKDIYVIMCFHHYILYYIFIQIMWSIIEESQTCNYLNMRNIDFLSDTHKFMLACIAQINRTHSTATFKHLVKQYFCSTFFCQDWEFIIPFILRTLFTKSKFTQEENLQQNHSKYRYVIRRLATYM